MAIYSRGLGAKGGSRLARGGLRLTERLHLRAWPLRDLPKARLATSYPQTGRVA
jgi:hypothetical protein